MRGMSAPALTCHICDHTICLSAVFSATQRLVAVGSSIRVNDVGDARVLTSVELAANAESDARKHAADAKAEADAEEEAEADQEEEEESDADGGDDYGNNYGDDDEDGAADAFGDDGGTCARRKDAVRVPRLRAFARKSDLESDTRVRCLISPCLSTLVMNPAVLYACTEEGDTM
jgi:hypothetical protein